MASHNTPSYPAQLSEEEWDGIRAQFAHSELLETLDKLRALKNLPQYAGDLFPEDTWNHGEEMVNNVFRRELMPYRMVRIGNRWARHNRRQRRLAIVRWPVGKQIRMQLVQRYEHVS